MHKIITRFYFIGIFFFSLAGLCQSQVSIGFISPDTTCTGQVINITDTTTGGSTYYWNFCSGNTLNNPLGINIGNPGNLLDVPSYISLVKDGGNCFSFITNGGTASVIRYFHGSSFNNNPVSWTNLGSFGLLCDSLQGISINKDNGQWIAIISNNNRLVRLNFGNSLANTPVATLLGPYSMVFSAHCLEILNEGGNWIGYLACTWGNNLVRLSFGSSLLNTPVLTNLGNYGGLLNMPRGFSLARENGNWYAILDNYGNSTLARLDFGNSLLNDPTVTSLGQLCGPIPLGGLVLIRDCNTTTGFQQNYTPNSGTVNEIFRLNFPDGFLGNVTATPMGNIGNMNRPNEFSQIIRVGDTLFTYVTNRQNATLTRLKFLPCSNASVSSSSQYNPPSFTYNQAGTFNVQLIVDEGLPTQASLCKNIVVVNPPVMNLGPDQVICQGTLTTLDAGPGFSSYLWSTGATTRKITVSTAGTYWAQGTKYGCQASDTVLVFVQPQPVPTLTGPLSVCVGSSGVVYSTDNSKSNYIWNISAGGIITSGSGTNSITVTWNTAGSQTISVNYTDNNGCSAINPTIDTVSVNPMNSPILTGPAQVCASSAGNTYFTQAGMSNYIWTVSSGGSITSGGTSTSNSVTVTWNAAGFQYVMVSYTDPNACTDNIPAIMGITVDPLPGPAGNIQGPLTVCAGTSGLVYSVLPIGYASWYTWVLPPGFSIVSGEGTMSIVVDVSASAAGGIMSVYGTNLCGQGQVSPPFQINVNQPATANAGPDQTTCTNQPYTVTGASAGNYSSVSWFTSGSGSLANNTTLSPTYTPAPSETGVVLLSLVAIGEAPCNSDTSTMQLTLAPKATASAGKDISSCGNRPVTISGSNADHYTSLQWISSGNGTFDNAAAVHPNYFPGTSDILNGQAILTLYAYSTPPCDPDSDILVLTLENGPSVTPGPDASICQGMSYTVHGFGIANSSSFSWESDGKGQLSNTGTLNPVYTAATGELGPVRVTLSAFGTSACSDSSVSCHMQLIIYSAPGIKAGKEQTLKYDSSTVLGCETSGGSGSFTFEWSPPALLVDHTLQNPQTVNLIKDVLFIVTATDRLTGCTATDSTRIKVGPREDDEDCIVIHNVITPNGDGLNDKLIIDCIEDFPENTLELFSRWGDPVNSFVNYNNKDVAWGGTTSKGEMLPDGTYFFILQLRNGKKYTGWVFLRSGTN